MLLYMWLIRSVFYTPRWATRIFAARKIGLYISFGLELAMIALMIRDIAMLNVGVTQLYCTSSTVLSFDNLPWLPLIRKEVRTPRALLGLSSEFRPTCLFTSIHVAQTRMNTSDRPLWKTTNETLVCFKFRFIIENAHIHTV